MSYKNWRSGRLICPYCKYDGTEDPRSGIADPFGLLEYVETYRGILSVEGRAPGPRILWCVDEPEVNWDVVIEERQILVCNRCNRGFSLPERALLEYCDRGEHEKYGGEWNEYPSHIICDDCGKFVDAEGDTCNYPCGCGKVTVLGDRVPDSSYIETAQRMYVEEGAVEIDSDPTVSKSEGGAYVQAWVWVPNEETKNKAG